MSEAAFMYGVLTHLLHCV